MEAIRFANSVLKIFAEIVETAHGAVDKFTGDGLLAHFGVLRQDPHHAYHACLCALEIQSSLGTVNRLRVVEDQPEVSVGIGIGTGLVAAGTISTGKKSEFSVFGDVVNTASRIENLTKHLQVPILVSEATYLLVEPMLEFERMPVIPLRGKKGDHVTYSLLPRGE